MITALTVAWLPGLFHKAGSAAFGAEMLRVLSSVSAWVRSAWSWATRSMMRARIAATAGPSGICSRAVICAFCAVSSFLMRVCRAAACASRRSVASASVAGSWAASSSPRQGVKTRLRRTRPRSRLGGARPRHWAASQASHRNSRHNEPSGFRSFERYKSDPDMLSQIPDSNTCSLNLLLFVVSVTDVDC